MTAGQPLDPKAEFSQPFLREVYLPVFKGIFVAAAHQERELIAISGEQAAEVEPIALRLVIGHETCGGGKKEQAIVAVQNALEFAHLGICHPIVFGPGHRYQHLEQGEGAARTRERPVREESQKWVVNHG